MLTIARLTLKEMIRRRILHVTLLLTVLFLSLYGTGVHYAFENMYNAGSPLRAMIIPEFLSLGLFFGSFLISFLAIMSSVGAISSDIENGTVFAIVPRPIRRSEIVLGKFLGYAVVLMTFAVIYYCAVLLILQSTTGLHVPLQLGTIFLYAVQPLVLLAVTLYGTTFLPTLANGIAVFMLYMLGVLGGMIEQIGFMLKNQTLIQMGIIASLIMPADSIYRKIVSKVLSAPGVNLSTYLLGPFGSGSEPSFYMLIYAGLYVTLFLALAVRTFSKRDI
ncbi:MAG: ABC transporter permease subunit [Desulfosporosinus sp.]|nr:ABC transporter permease subunit [Desulfosporosinus sp.]